MKPLSGEFIFLLITLCHDLHHRLFLLFVILFFNYQITMTQLTNSYALLDNTIKPQVHLKILQTSSQPVTEEKAEAGKIYNTVTQETKDYLDLLILGVRREFRVWRDNQKGLAKYPEWASDDMNTLIHLNPETGQKISEEPLEQSELWLNRFDNPLAQTQYCFLAALSDNATPVTFRIHGLGVKPARNFLNQARYSKRQLYEFITRLSVEKQNTSFGLKYVPRLEILDTPMPEKYNPERASDVCQDFINQSSPPARNKVLQ